MSISKYSKSIFGSLMVFTDFALKYSILGLTIISPVIFCLSPVAYIYSLIGFNALIFGMLISTAIFNFSPFLINNVKSWGFKKLGNLYKEDKNAILKENIIRESIMQGKKLMNPAEGFQPTILNPSFQLMLDTFQLGFVNKFIIQRRLNFNNAGDAGRFNKLIKEGRYSDAESLLSAPNEREFVDSIECFNFLERNKAYSSSYMCSAFFSPPNDHELLFTHTFIFNEEMQKLLIEPDYRSYILLTNPDSKKLCNDVLTVIGEFLLDPRILNFINLQGLSIEDSKKKYISSNC